MPFKQEACLDAPHTTFIITRRSIRYFVIVLFGADFYYKIRVHPKSTTISRETQFMIAVFGAKAEKYITIIL